MRWRSPLKSWPWQCFYDFISSIEKIYQTRTTVCDHVFKNLESVKNTPLRVVFSTLLGVWKCGQILIYFIISEEQCGTRYSKWRLLYLLTCTLYLFCEETASQGQFLLYRNCKTKSSKYSHEICFSVPGPHINKSILNAFDFLTTSSTSTKLPGRSLGTLIHCPSLGWETGNDLVASHQTNKLTDKRLKVPQLTPLSQGCYHKPLYKAAILLHNRC